jgi:hypothetical protein
MKFLSVLVLSLVTSSAFAQVSEGFAFLTYLDSTSRALETLVDETKCMQDGERTLVRIPVVGAVQPGRSYFGVSSYGDIGIVNMTNSSEAVLNLYVCDRPGLITKTASQYSPIVLEPSNNCPVDQISAAWIKLEGEEDGGFLDSFMVALTPISIDGTERKSSLCNNQVGVKVSQNRRENKEVLNETKSPSTNTQNVTQQ